MDLYPVEDCFTNDVKKGLIAHFEESEADENDETYIGDIDEYIAIFEGIKEYNGYLLGVYNEPSSLMSNKIVHKNIFDQKKSDMTSASDSGLLEMDLIEECDYIDLVKRVFSEPDELYIRISNYTGDMNRLKDHIALLAYYWKDYTEIFYIQPQTVADEFDHRDEYGDILSPYMIWLKLKKAKRLL